MRALDDEVVDAEAAKLAEDAPGRGSEAGRQPMDEDASVRVAVRVRALPVVARHLLLVLPPLSGAPHGSRCCPHGPIDYRAAALRAAVQKVMRCRIVSSCGGDGAAPCAGAADRRDTGWLHAGLLSLPRQ
eukprot:COSAG01_NODE_16291_length_1250_cov_1.316247_1_plen_129_part_10